MARVTSAPAVEVPSSFMDVLYLTNQKQMPHEIKRFLKHKRLSFLVLPIKKFSQISNRLELIGTVVIDTKGSDFSQRHELARIVESLGMKNIGVILLGNRMELPVKSFSLAGPAVRSFSLVSTVESFSVNELSIRIDTNLAYRKKSSEVTAKPPVPLEQAQSAHGGGLAEQLNMTEAFVDNLAEQLRVAGLVQRDFLPTQLPDSDRVRWGTIFLPAEWVSGDIYDIVRVDEQHMGFYVADVVGHGIPAALLTIFLKQALVMRETIGSNYRIFSPAEVMTNLNLRMTGQKLSGHQFATCCYCLLNMKTLQLTYARAGHPYPLLIRPEQQLQQLETRGSLLGIFEQSEYIQQTIQLRAGDKLILYSDGAEPVVGAFDETSRFNFTEEFCEIKDLPIAEMMDKFSMLMANKETDASEVDDITVISLEIL